MGYCYHSLQSSNSIKRLIQKLDILSLSIFLVQICARATRRFGFENVSTNLFWPFCRFLQEGDKFVLRSEVGVRRSRQARVVTADYFCHRLMRE